MSDGPFKAYINGTSVVLNAPADVVKNRYVRDKVDGDITFTPIADTAIWFSQIATVVIARVAGSVVVLAVWKEYIGRNFTRTVDESGTIKYTEVKK